METGLLYLLFIIGTILWRIDKKDGNNVKTLMKLKSIIFFERFVIRWKKETYSLRAGEDRLSPI